MLEVTLSINNNNGKTNKQSWHRLYEKRVQLISKKNELDNKVYEKRKNANEDSIKMLENLLEKIKLAHTIEELLDIEKEIDLSYLRFINLKTNIIS